MSTEFEQHLRAEMEQVEVSPRPGLVHEAYRSYRGKRRRTRALAATGTAVAIAAATAVGVAAATASPAAIPTQTTADITSHISRALATSNEISEAITSYGTPANIQSYGPPDHIQSVLVNWKYGTRWRDLSESASGRPDLDNWGAGWGRPGDYQIIVNYPQRSWERYADAKGSATLPSFACQSYGRYFFGLALWEPANLGSVIESGLRCGAFHVAGHQRVEGIDTIKLTGIVEGRPAFTLWVDARTYLPREVTYPHGVTQFRWLPPTQANLAQLTGTIPPGFHRN